MESEQKIRDARKRMKKLLGNKGKRGARLHQQAADDINNRLRALDGLCGRCEEMYVELFTKEGKERANVLCHSGHRPFIIYSDTPLGQQPKCKDHEPAQEHAPQILSK